MLHTSKADSKQIDCEIILYFIQTALREERFIKIGKILINVQKICINSKVDACTIKNGTDDIWTRSVVEIDY